jgi:Zn-dependent protease
MYILQLLQNPISLIAFFGALVIAISFHEFAHAFAAYKLGDPTAKSEGRVTLNPLAHLDPIGTIFLFIVGFGWGRPVPVNPNYFRKKSDELIVAFAGIITNLLIAFVLSIPIRIFLSQGGSLEDSTLYSILAIIAQLNIYLAAFNLLPIPPLDGSHLVEYFLDEEGKAQYQYIGPFILMGLIAIDFLTHTSILSLIMRPIVNLFSFMTTGSPAGFL